MRVGYLASHYPAVSHTFVLREIRALRRLGVEIETFSIHRAPPEQLLAAADREEARGTYAVLPVRPLDLVWSHLTALCRAPSRYLATAALALRLARAGRHGPLGGLLYFAEAMPVWRAARRRGIRHLHAVFADVASDVAMLVAAYGGDGWSFSVAVHGPNEFYDVHRHALAAKLAAARFVVAISDFGRSQLMTLTDASRWHDIHVVHCGIDPAAFPAPPDGDGVTERDDRRPHILCVGRLVHIKGQSLLIEALAILRDHGLDPRLTLVGEGPTRAELERSAARLDVSDRVTFTGAVGQDHIQSIYRDADVFCLASMAEGLPVVFMEAMALELAVVATRIMGVPELVEDERTGLVVAPGRSDLLAGAIERLLADAPLRRRLARQGRDKVLSEFDISLSATTLRAILEAHLGP